MKGKSLSMFLWFCNVENIDEHFTFLEGLHWHPIARTSGPLLELPSTYESYPALVEEFTDVMEEEQAWFFNIV